MASLGHRKCLLIGKNMVTKHINRETFKTTILKVWETDAIINFVEVEKNTFIFEFASNYHLNHIWDGQSWLFDQNLLLFEVV